MNKLKIRTYGMFGGTHSWSLCLRKLFEEFHKMGHDLYINTTNGIDLVPKYMYKYFRDCQDPDIDLCYTLPSNFAYRFAEKAKTKIGIYNYESSILPREWIKYHEFVDYLAPSSEYCKQVFINSGIPSSKVKIIPLGINPEDFNKPAPHYNLNTKKRFKFLNISVPHVRKNIPLLIDCYFSEFSAEDDVCLIIKSTPYKDDNNKQFIVDIPKTIEAIKKNFTKDLPEVEIIEERVPDISSLYNQCDCLVNVAAVEGWGLPLNEFMCFNKLVCAPKYGGVLEFLNKSNSILFDTIEVFAPPQYQYWNADKKAVIGLPIKEDVMKKLRMIYLDYNALLRDRLPYIQNTVKRFTWENSAKQIIEIATLEKPKYRILGELIK